MGKANLDALRSNLVLVRAAENNIKDLAQNRIIILLDNGQVNYLDIIDND